MNKADKTFQVVCKSKKGDTSDIVYAGEFYECVEFYKNNKSLYREDGKYLTLVAR